MEDFGFVRVAAAVPVVKVADCMGNAAACLELIEEAAENRVQIICFPELNLTGYTCGDLFHSRLLVRNAEKALSWLLEQTARLDIVAIVGLPVHCGLSLFNVAVVIRKGEILAATSKTYLPNYNEFYEKRWFASMPEAQRDTLDLCGRKVRFGRNIVYDAGRVMFAVEICEDLWTPVPPSSTEALAGAQIIFNLSASDESAGKNRYLRSLIQQQSARCIAGYVYASCGFGESSTDLYFGGNGYIAENGVMLAESQRFSFDKQLVISDIDVEQLSAEREKNSTYMMGVSYAGGGDYLLHGMTLPAWSGTTLLREVNPMPFLPADRTEEKEYCEEIFNIQTGALALRLKHIKCDKVVIGISGGLDSTLALLVAARTFDKLGFPRKNIIGVTMPGFGTTGWTYDNALKLMKSLDIDVREISIADACRGHLKDIGHPQEVHNAVYENAQARERTQILFDVSNKENAIVLGTGDLSELALGWCTYGGDHLSSYGINAGIPKTLVRYLVNYAANNDFFSSKSYLFFPLLTDILETPISPELLPADTEGSISQKTEDLVGPYDLHDFFLYYTLRHGFSPAKIRFLAGVAFEGQFDDAVILKWLKVFVKRFFTQQFKRSCMPDGPKVVSVGLSPRGDWRMPSDASFREWLENCENDKKY